MKFTLAGREGWKWPRWLALVGGGRRLATTQTQTVKLSRSRGALGDDLKVSTRAKVCPRKLRKSHAPTSRASSLGAEMTLTPFNNNTKQQQGRHTTTTTTARTPN